MTQDEEESQNHHIWSTYEMPENKRKAVIWRHVNTFWVYMYEDNYIIEKRPCTDKNIRWAEDLAENWVHKWGPEFGA
tara:strand:- start:145 stop:375 length:231 start_codon:yes stop_codon:yes gene_type:complete